MKDHYSDLQYIVAPKNGFVYIYCSNETPVDVFFDNLQVVHTRSPILEEAHYYPFGLVQSGISSKAAGEMINKDKTFQKQRLDDDFGLDWVQFKYRNHDVQIGRFVEIDPLSSKYVYNSVYGFSENHVTAHIELEGLEKVPINADDFNNIFHGNKINLDPPASSLEKNEKKDDDKKPHKSLENKGNSKSIILKQTATGEETENLAGVTTTNKLSSENSLKSGWGDEITASKYIGTVTGKEGNIITTDVSTSNGKVEGASISLFGVITAGVGTDLSLSIGVGAFGYEGHIGVGVGNGLGQVSVGASHTEKGVVTGGDLTVKPGLGVVAAAAFIYATGGFGALAF